MSLFFFIGDQEITSDREVVLVEKLKVLYESFNRTHIINASHRLLDGINIYETPDNSFESFLCRVNNCLICNEPLTKDFKYCHNETCAGRGLTTLSQFLTVDEFTISNKVQLDFHEIMKEILAKPEDI